MKLSLSAVTLAALIAFASFGTVPAPALAQGKTGSLGGGAGSGPVMTRDELRACFKSQAELKQRVTDYEAMKAAADKDKAAILADNQALVAEKAQLAATAGKVNEENARNANLAQRVEDWKARWEAFEKSGRAGPMADRERKKLLDEQRALERENDAARAAAAGGGGVSGGSETSAAAKFNAKADAVSARTVAYNERNKQLVKMGEDLQQERDLWAGECGSRRFREEDEIAIKQGK
jgi:hypothetical protein